MWSAMYPEIRFYMRYPMAIEEYIHEIIDIDVSNLDCNSTYIAPGKLSKNPVGTVHIR